MSAGFSSLKGLLLCVIAVSGMAIRANAQQAGQSIVFSTPPSEAAKSSSSSSTSDSGDSSKRRTIVDPIQVPSSDFSISRAPTQLPRPTIRMPEKSERNDRDNWAFMTPAEILGVATPEKMLGIPDRDASGNRTDSTVQERYMQRLSRAQPAYTNSFLSGNTKPSWNVGDNDQKPSVWDSINSVNPNGNVDNSSASRYSDNGYFGRNNFNNSAWDANPADNSGWSKLVGSPKPLTDYGPSQRTALQQFQEMLNTKPATIETKTTVTPGYKIQSPQVFAFSPEVANPIGGSATPVRSGVGLPSVLPTLPTVTRQTTKSSSSSPMMPSWKANRTEPPDFTIPKRQDY